VDVTVRSAKNVEGELQVRPEVYKKIVKDKVQAPFSSPREGPAVPTWRVLSDDEKLTGVPFWWDSLYSRSSKGIPSEAWSGLMQCPTPESPGHDGVTDIGGGKSPGHDGVSADLLKLAIWLLPLRLPFELLSPNTGEPMLGGPTNWQMSDCTQAWRRSAHTEAWM
jgi:hypothetical protein